MNQNMPSNLTPWIIWFYLFVSIFVYAVILFVIQREEAIVTDSFVLWGGGFAALSVGLIIATFQVRKQLFFSKFENGDYETIDTMQRSYATTSIISWVLADGIAILGFVFAFMANQASYYYFFMIPALVLFLYTRPQNQKFSEIYNQKFPRIPDIETETETVLW